MREFIVEAPVVIRTRDFESCATEYPDACPFWSDYECELFHKGEVLEAKGSGDSFRNLRHSECRRLTGDE